MAHTQARPAETLVAYNIGIGVFYFVAAFVSWHLVTPPGYATAIWPAAGVALAMMLLYGTRLWPGLLAGATLANLFHLYDPSVGAGSLHQSMLIAFGLGVAATLQGLAGYWLVKPRVDLDGGLVDSPSIIRLMILGGPVGCLVSSTLSVALLFGVGIIPSYDLPFNWVTWWAGDGIGVMLVVPLMFAWLAQPRAAWEIRKSGVAMPVIAAFAIVLVIYLVEIEEHEKVTAARFENQAENLGNSLEQKIQRNFEVVYSLQGLFESAEIVDRVEFQEYVSRALQRNSGIHALSWNPVVARSRRSEFEASMQARGFTGFKITERNDDGELMPAGEREFYVVVQYIEPLESNLKALGFDVFSNTQRKEALRSAHVTGDLTGTAPITLIQETGSQTGVLFALPVQRYPSESRELAAAADLPSGYVVGVFRVGNLLMEAAEGSNMNDVLLRLTDVDDAARPTLLAHYRREQNRMINVGLDERGDHGSMVWQKTYSFGKRNWSFEIRAAPTYLSGAHLWTLWGVFAIGLMFTTALSTFLLILSGRAIIDQSRADQLAREIAEREAVEFKLHLTNERLEIIASTDDLTQIYNRRAIEEIGAKLEAEARRYKTPFAVLLLDIDHFKSVNDQWGHKTGDLVLKDFTNSIREALRDVDEFGRWGGEEFMILARNSRLDEASEFAERLVAMVANRPIDPVGHITTSIGVAVSRDAETFDEIVLRADRALYTAKSNGRNRVEVDKTATLPTRKKGA